MWPRWLVALYVAEFGGVAGALFWLIAYLHPICG
jgi:hypothetical protein